MSRKMTKLAVRAYFVLACTAAPVVVAQAQSSPAGQPAGQGAGGAAGQPGATGAAGGQDYGYTQSNDRDGNGKAGWFGLLGLVGLLGLRGRRNESTVRVREDVPNYESTGTRRP